MTTTQMSRSCTDLRMAGDGEEDGLVVAWGSPVKTEHKKSGVETRQSVKMTRSARERGGHEAAAGEEKRHRRGPSSARERWWGDKDDHVTAASSAAVPTCIWMSFSASHRISSAVHDIGTALDVLQEILFCILSSFSSPYMSFLCCNVLGRDRSILRLGA